VSQLLEYWPVVLSGLWVTIWVSLLTILFSAIGALVLGPMRLSRIGAIRLGTMALIELVRGPSGLVWLFWVFYAVPLIPGMPRFSPITASVIVLSCIGAAYASEIVRAGIEAVHRGQSDASHALGLSPMQSLRKVIIPQALSQIVPAFGSMAADMVKWSAIVSFVGVPDILYVANNIRNDTYKTVLVFSLLALIYWVLCLLTTSFFRLVEKWLPLNRALRAAHVARMAPSGNSEIAGANA
jgi:His/Glu/Gln/Arg/opine family amino acid ABC transporter permease subunit